jgi:hypothetical protein
VTLADQLPEGANWVARRFERLEREVRELRAALAAISDRAGTGSPEGAVAAPVGTRYVDRAGAPGGVLWVKTAGSSDTGWTAIA